MQRKTFLIEDDELRRLRENADGLGVSLNAYIRLAVMEKNNRAELSIGVAELQDQVATEFQAMQKELSSMKQDMTSLVSHKVKEANAELSKELNNAFAFELDRMQEELKEIVRNALLMQARDKFERPVIKPTSTR